MSETRAWLPRAEWVALRSGTGCPMCTEIPDIDEFGYTVARLSKSVLRLCRDQFSTGYSVLICTEHGPEPHSLEPADTTAFLADLTRAGEALERAFGADKMNYLMLGNSVPHLHAHLVPRYHGDPAPGAPYLPVDAPDVTVSEAAYQERVESIRRALA